MKHLTVLIIASLSLVLPLTATVVTLEQMSQAEQKSCGIEKLSKEEKQELNSWLEKQSITSLAEPTSQNDKTDRNEFTVKSIDDQGRYVTLTNGLTYQIHARSRKKTESWQAGDNVCLVEAYRSPSYRLENSRQKQTVSGKQVQASTKEVSTQVCTQE